MLMFFLEELHLFSINMAASAINTEVASEPHFRTHSPESTRIRQRTIMITNLNIYDKQVLKTLV